MNKLKTSFAQIEFSTANCICVYNISTTNGCSIFNGAYGIVFCREDGEFAYKVIFCQDNGGSTIYVKVNGADVKKMRRSSYANALYESKISHILAKRNTFKDFCVFVNSKLDFI